MSETDSIAHDDFSYDMAYLNGLADFILEIAGHQLAYPQEATVFARLKADMSCSARKAVFGNWPETSMFGPLGTIQKLWEAA